MQELVNSNSETLQSGHNKEKRPSAPRYNRVIWEPRSNWVKVNIDGSYWDTNHVGFGGVSEVLWLLF